jgi:hypothetical protein
MIKSRRMRWAGHVARMGEKRNACKMSGKPEGKIRLRRPRRTWADNIKMNLGEIGWDLKRTVYWLFKHFKEAYDSGENYSEVIFYADCVM